MLVLDLWGLMMVYAELFLLRIKNTQAVILECLLFRSVQYLELPAPVHARRLSVVDDGGFKEITLVTIHIL